MQTLCALQFKPVTLQNYKEIAPYLIGKHAVICDLSLLYFHMWGDMLGIEYAFFGDVLFLRRNNKYGLSYYPPRVKGEGLVAGLSYLSVLEAPEVRLCAVPEHEVEHVEQYCRVLEKGTSRRWADYVYSASDLATLSGHRYNKKRNLVHQFERLYPTHLYEAISADNLAEVQAFMQRFADEGEANEDKQYENRRVLALLEDYEELPLVGGLVRVDGEIAAFSIGEIIDEVLLVHVEKADRRFKGAYQYINYRFVQEQVSQHAVVLVNREDDAGDEGLRQAKLSYCPVQILHKYHMIIDNKE